MKCKITLILSTLVLLTSMLGFTATGVAGANGTQPPTISKTASPTDINIAGSGLNEDFTVTITVTGAGGTSTTITPIDIVFSLDCSGSMNWNDYTDLRATAAKDFIDKLDNSRDTAGVNMWSGYPLYSYGLTSDFPTLKSNIDTYIRDIGNTNLNVGLNGAIAMLDANTRTDPSAEVIIFLTDGEGTYTPSGNTGSPADNAASKGYVIYTIGLGSAAMGPLNDMATTTGGTAYSSPTAENLQAIFDTIYNEVITSTIPYQVDVIEVTQSYIVDEGSFNPVPTSVSTFGEITTIRWEDIGSYDADPEMDSNETVVLTFTARSNQAGTNLDVQVPGSAVVNYSDKDGNPVGSVPVPQVKINVNSPPVANAGTDQTVEQTSFEGTAVTLDGSGSTDDGKIQPLTYSWIWTGGSASGVSPTVPLPPGNTAVTLTVNDGQLSATDIVDITVSDTTAPQVTLETSHITLWPPNHDMVDVGLILSFSDIGDANPTVVLSITQDEKVDEDTGDGNFSPDARILLDDSGNITGLGLRAERNGDGDGRVYLIIVTVTDASDNVMIKYATVTVPKSQSKKDINAVTAQAATAMAASIPLPYDSTVGPVIGPKQ
ncbi:MAG: VWA domain-containing protein [Dehalococcoidales bacterium]|nr:VWA domain-containing protein [Dehalococcoidales bacterium]